MRPADRRPRPALPRIEVVRIRLIDPSVDDRAAMAGSGAPRPTLPLSSVQPERTLAAAECFLSQRTSNAPAVVAAYEQLLQQKWRMSPGDYLELWRGQEKKCAICGSSLTLYHRDTHVHVFGYLKRLLCTTCNRGMECFRDDPSLLVKALEQIEQSSGENGDQKNQQKGPDSNSNEGATENSKKTES